MKYFETLPLVVSVDQNNNQYALKNLVVRGELVDKLKNNVNLFYNYSVQDGDTPEIVAHKYYGDQNRYWMVLMANNIFDPQWNWPLKSNEFTDYINDKYSAAAAESNLDVLSYTTSTVHHYEKLVTTLDSETLYQTVKNITIDEETYNSIIEKNVIQTLPNGSTVSYSVSKKPVYIYDYEVAQNETKRNIKLIKSQYAADMERQLKKIMGT